MSGLKSRISGMFGYRSSAAPESPIKQNGPGSGEEKEEEEEEEEEEEPIEEAAEEEEEEEEGEEPIPVKKIKRKRDPTPVVAAAVKSSSSKLPVKVNLIGELPNKEEWAAAKVYRVCEVPPKGDEKSFRIRVGDYIYVKPGEQEVVPATPSKAKGKGKVKVVKAAKSEVWLARVNELRACDKAKVFINISWLYTAAQLKASGYKHTKALDLHGAEVVLTNHREVIAVGSCEDMATVFDFVETDLDQAQIAEDDYYIRHEILQFDGKGLKAPPAPYCPPTCYCEKPYAVAEVMHYCPRSTCERWYHADCLESKDREINDTLEYIISLPGNPGDDNTVVSPPPRKKGRPAKKSKAAAAKAPTSSYTHTILATAPLALLTLASEPIVRGGERFGIVGNAKRVLQARKMLKTFCEGDEEADGETGVLPEEWRKELGLEELEEDEEEEYVGVRGVGAPAGSKGRKVQPEEWKEEEVFICHGCEGKI